MDTLISIISSVFWGAIVLSVLVFVHEGGHFLAARSCGVRVTEFFLGLPCSVSAYRRARRYGTKFGVTPLLLGGYAAICGMDPEESPLAPQVLRLVHEKGRAKVMQMAEELDAAPLDVVDACAQLCTWGSIEPIYDPELGEKPGNYYPETYAAMPRDAQGNTVLDGRRFKGAEATELGEPWRHMPAEAEFYQRERSRTYIGKGFFPRAYMLLAGILVNIVTGFLIMVFAYTVLGTTVLVNSNELGGVTAGSPAAEAGLRAHDVLTSVDGATVETWTDILTVLDGVEAGDTVEVAYEREGAPHTASLTLDAEGRVGIEVLQETHHLPPFESIKMTSALISQTAQGVLRLITPQHTMEVLDSSSSIVGISVMSSQAASLGVSPFLKFMALISFSLAFMNLLPIPPLDGGKLVLEAIQAVIRRPVPVRVQTILSYVGVALFAFLFIYMLRVDVLRIIGL